MGEWEIHGAQEDPNQLAAADSLARQGEGHTVLEAGDRCLMPDEVTSGD